uniref:ARAD1B14388p n=1 Tax=Blastobotrys adeninivorans TaxID=409370 RepID=A0A060T5T6_BLAAD
MKVLITGAGGFLGKRLSQALVDQFDQIALVITDVVEPPSPTIKDGSNAKVHSVKADLCVESERSKLLEIVGPFDKVFMLHGIMSGGSEADFDLGMAVNVDATRGMLELLRHKCPGIRVVFTSSTGVYGGKMPKVITEDVIPIPQSSYGAEKTICEYLVGDYGRRGFLDSIAIRYPTVIVRPGPPSSATSSFCSGIIREPLAGQDAELPVSRDLAMWFGAVSNVVHNTVYAGFGLDTSAIEAGESRTINLPGVTVTVQQMLDALVEVGGEKMLDHIKDKKDPKLERIVTSWPAIFDTKKANALGFRADPGFKQAIYDYVKEQQ